jgi:hypothetical protein
MTLATQSSRQQEGLCDLCHQTNAADDKIGLLCCSCVLGFVGGCVRAEKLKKGKEQKEKRSTQIAEHNYQV